MLVLKMLWQILFLVILKGACLKKVQLSKLKNLIIRKLLVLFKKAIGVLLMIIGVVKLNLNWLLVEKLFILFFFLGKYIILGIFFCFFFGNYKIQLFILFFFFSFLMPYFCQIWILYYLFFFCIFFIYIYVYFFKFFFLLQFRLCITSF